MSLPGRIALEAIDQSRIDHLILLTRLGRRSKPQLQAGRVVTLGHFPRCRMPPVPI